MEKAISWQTNVKNQGSRGTCSIFSAVGLLESILIQYFNQNKNIDLSEEWVEFLAMKDRQKDGYWSFKSWKNITLFGIADEKIWKYVGKTWKSKKHSNLSLKRCQNLNSSILKSCLLAHRNPDLLNTSDRDLIDPLHRLHDPEFKDIRNNALKNKVNFIDGNINAASHFSYNYQVEYIWQIKELLSKNVPLTLAVDFYYGAWNHSQANSLKIGRNLTHWNQGIVGFPEIGSSDYLISNKSENRAGHSIVIVGYDDDIVIKTKIKMQDGSIKNFTYKGVYFFKNSWGINSFGKKTSINNKTYPGYGIIVQDYAHQYGSFYKLPIF